MKRTLTRGICAMAACVALLGVAPAGTFGVATAHGAVVSSADDVDRIYLRSGRIVEGRIIQETSTEIRMEVVVGGIKAPTTYSKDEVLRVERGDAQESDDAAESGESDGGVDVDRLRERLRGGGESVDPSLAGAPTVYHMPLRGWLGSDINTRIVSEMLEDARRQEPDFLVIEIDRRWQRSVFEDAPDDLGNASKFDEFSVADEIEALFTKEMPRTWRKIPHIVVWVKSAMGGAAFLPFVGDEIYFHPDGRMGGVGNLGELFGSTGDHVVRQKQRSLRLARAQGMAIAGGYDYRIVTAMTMRAYELSYRAVGGTVELFEGVASRANEQTLTENGTIRENQDSLRDVVRGTGDDVLTLKAETAKTLGVSKGNAETFNDVLAGMGILRNHRKLDGRAEKIMDDWIVQLDELGRTMPQMWEDYQQVAVGRNGVDDEREAIGRRMRILQDIKRLIDRYGNALFVPEGLFGIEKLPPAWGVPQPGDLEILLEQHRVQLMGLNG